MPLPLPRITLLQASPEPRIDAPKPERLISPHSPRRETHESYQSADGTFESGIWNCEVGHWKIQFAPTAQEFFCVRSGLVRLHHPDGSFVEVGPGQAAVIPPGYQGSFEVVEPVSKYFVFQDLSTK